MLIPLDMIVKKYGIPKGTRVVHVGAHQAQEYDDYRKQKFGAVAWIEANEALALDLVRRFRRTTDQLVVNVVLADEQKTVTFNEASFDQSSSILPLGTHAKMHPEIKYVGQTTHMADTLDNIADEHELHGYEFLNLDVQGAEQMVLDGGLRFLESCNFIYSEVNAEELYKGCTLKPKFDAFLDALGFDCVETEMTHFQWGDRILCKKRKSMKFKIVVASWNAAPWLERCLISINEQTDQNFDACVVIDGSTDESAEIVAAFIADKSNFQMIVNEEKGCTLKSQRQAIEAMGCEDEDVIVWLDGDDCFSNSNVLSKLSNYYGSSDILVTYGSYVPVPADRGCAPASVYPAKCISMRDFRDAEKWGFQFNHLRTMKSHVYSKIPLEYLTWPDGSWLTVGGDAAEMICALEMAGDRHLFIKDVLVNYTSDNSNSDWRIASPEIRRTHARIMSMPKLDLLQELKDRYDYS